MFMLANIVMIDLLFEIYILLSFVERYVAVRFKIKLGTGGYEV